MFTVLQKKTMAWGVKLLFSLTLICSSQSALAIDDAELPAKQQAAIRAMEQAKTPEEALGTSVSATAEEIKKAFRSRSMLLHPDSNPDPRARDSFAKLKAASACLTASSLHDRQARYSDWARAYLDGEVILKLYPLFAKNRNEEHALAKSVEIETRAKKGEISDSTYLEVYSYLGDRFPPNKGFSFSLEISTLVATKRLDPDVFKRIFSFVYVYLNNDDAYSAAKNIALEIQDGKLDEKAFVKTFNLTKKLLSPSDALTFSRSVSNKVKAKQIRVVDLAWAIDFLRPRMASDNVLKTALSLSLSAQAGEVDLKTFRQLSLTFSRHSNSDEVFEDAERVARLIKQKKLDQEDFLSRYLVEVRSDRHPGALARALDNK